VTEHLQAARLLAAASESYAVQLARDAESAGHRTGAEMTSASGAVRFNRLKRFKKCNGFTRTA
jgi:hypothetical protein